MNFVKCLIALLLIACPASKAYSLTLSELLTQTRVFLRDTASDSARQRFSDTQLTSFLNNGQKEVNLKVWAVINSSAIKLSAGTTEYSLPTDHIAVLRITANHSPLVERDFKFFDDASTSWISDSGTPTEYYVRVDSSLVAGVSRECFGVHPVSTAAATAIVQYLAQPADLSASGDIPFSGNLRLYPFHQGLAYYAAYRGYLAMGTREEAAFYMRDYENLVALMEANTKTRFMFNPNIRGFLPPPQITQQQAQ